VAVPFKIGVCDLLAELFAFAFGVLVFLAATGAIPPVAPQPLEDCADELLVLVKAHFHFLIPLVTFYSARRARANQAYPYTIK